MTIVLDPTAPARVSAAERSLRAGPLADRVMTHRGLADLCTYRVGGAADLFVEVRDLPELLVVADVVSTTGVDTLMVGRGSNLLVAQAGFRGLALVLGDGFASIDIDRSTVIAGASASLPVVARRTVAAGLTGFEWAVGVPGSIGGAVRMNAGGHGSDMAASLKEATIVDLAEARVVIVPVAQLALGYRSSSVGADQVVVSATLELVPGDETRGRSELDEIVRWRRDHQPGGPNAGSVFTNPTGQSAGKLIDQAGGKGFRVGTAEVSTKHANFIQADSGGSADDVRAVMVAVAELVERVHGVVLHPETHMVGFEPGWDAARSDGARR